ncbi:MAG: EVE domain-containing protein [Alphaproteobacteria bacterium]
MAYWLMKSEPDVFSYDDLVRKGRERWDGVRNYTARNNLRAMRVGDDALFYHSNAGKLTGVVGICRVVKGFEVDGTFQPERGKPNPWGVVTVAPVRALARVVTLAEMKACKALADMELLRYGRLSVQKVTPAEWRAILAMVG